jgi:hypothetical protein
VRVVGDEPLDVGAADAVDESFGEPAMECAHGGWVVGGGDASIR